MDDATLIARVKAGNMHACRFLVDKHRNLVWHMVLRMIRQQEDAEDICQEVFFRVFRDLYKFRGASKLSTWIGSITYHICIDHLRKKEKQVTSSAENLEYAAGRRQTLEQGGIKIERDDLKRMVHKVVDTLPVQYRTVITLFHLEEFSYHEIEEITGMPEGTVKSYLNRARAMVRAQLEQQVPDIRQLALDNS
jgi:RNA polymerase sigma-70 factor (ECF subfamily)